MIKKLLVLTLIILFLFPTISSAIGKNETVEYERNNIRNINIQDQILDSNSHANEVGDNNPTSIVKRIVSLLYLPAIKSLDRIIHPLNNSPLNLSDEDLDVLSYMSDCKIVGLGEATHGTKEFFQLKHRIFKYLVENHGFSIYAFECDMGESYYVDDFITKGEGDLDDIMKNIMHFWTWRTEEVKELLLWMKEYNEDKTNENKIHFIGVDCQAMTFQADLIMNYFNKTNVSLGEENIEFLTEFNQIPPNYIEFFLNMTLEQKEEIDQNVDILINKIEHYKNELIFNSTEFEYEFIKRIALNIKQVVDVHYGSVNGVRKNYRDLYMAQNTLWTSKLFGENTKAALWAHNGHVANSRFYGSSGSMGFHLKKELKELYQIIGFAFSQGNFTAIKIEDGEFQGLEIWQLENEPKFGSINYLFHRAKYKNFILKKSDIRIFSFFNKYIIKPHLIISIGAAFSDDFFFYYRPVLLKLNYDVIINWDYTSAAEQLS